MGGTHSRPGEVGGRRLCPGGLSSSQHRLEVLVGVCQLPQISLKPGVLLC